MEYQDNWYRRYRKIHAKSLFLYTGHGHQRDACLATVQSAVYNISNIYIIYTQVSISVSTHIYTSISVSPQAMGGVAEVWVAPRSPCVPSYPASSPSPGGGCIQRQ